MLLSLKWLREFVPYQGSAQELGDRLTMAGLELEGVLKPFAGLEPIVVGLVLECAKHPEADKLSVCRVDVGEEILDIVCGAPNVAQGQKVAVVKVGSTLPNGLTIKKAKLRGAPSHGMICSEAELGLSDEHDGIMVLDPAARIGSRLLDVLSLDEEVLEIGITPNRGDCLSVLGLAREVAALYRLPLTLPRFNLIESGSAASEAVSLEVADPDMCPLYQGRVLDGAITRQSPDWLRYRLHAVGLRAISNLVDVTNYILMELGQPLHAFDLDKIRGGRIIVRGADAGERTVTLDGQTRDLLPADITIRDARETVCIGGVMGSSNSEVTETTRRVFLECAIFNPSNIRKTARRLGLSSDASYRFERGVDQTGAGYALDEAAAMMAELSGAAVLAGVLKQEPRPWRPCRMSLRKSKAEDLLGIGLDDAFCSDTLIRLGCAVEPASSSFNGQPVWEVDAPGHRPDLTREADLIEEIARIYGLDRIEPVAPSICRPLSRAGRPETMFSFTSRIKHWASGIGLNEAVSYSFTSHKELDLFDPEGSAGPGRIDIMNPLSDEQNVLRTLIAPGLLYSLRNNLSQGAPAVRLFETAAAFTADASSPTTAQEEPRLALLLCGNRYDGWPLPQADLEYQDIKGIIEHLLRTLHLGQADFSLAEPAEYPWLAPAVEILVGDCRVGFTGQVSPAIADRYHARKPVWLAELRLDALYGLHNADKVRFSPLPVFPPVRRDVTLICQPGVTNRAILEAVAALRLPLLAEFRLIDSYEPKGRSERNLTYRLTFRHQDKTLKDAEVDKQRDALVAGLTKALPVRV